MCFHDFIPGLILRGRKERTQNFYRDGWTCSPIAFTLRTAKTSIPEIMVSCCRPLAGMLPCRGSWSCPNLSSLCVALGCMTFIIFSLNGKEFETMFCITLENFMNLFQLIAKNPQRSVNPELGSLIQVSQANLLK